MHADIPLETRIVLITGTQSADKAKLARDLATRVDGDFADFDSETIAADGTPIDRLLSAVSTAPFGDGKRVVLITHAEQLDDATQKKLASGIDGRAGDRGWESQKGHHGDHRAFNGCEEAWKAC